MSAVRNREASASWRLLMYYNYAKESIGNTALVRYREVVRFSEGPLSEARLYYVILCRVVFHTKHWPVQLVHI